MASTPADFAARTRPYPVAHRSLTAVSSCVALSTPVNAVLASARMATRPKRSISSRPSSPLHPPGGCNAARTTIPPAHIPAETTWIASSMIAGTGGSTLGACPDSAITSTATKPTGTAPRPIVMHRASATASAAIRISTPSVTPVPNTYWSMAVARPPARATPSTSCSRGLAQGSAGGFAARRRITTAPVNPSRPASSSQRSAAASRSGGCMAAGRQVGARDRGEDVVLPATVDAEVARRSALDLEAGAFEHAGAALVARHVAGRHPVKPPVAEREAHHATHGLGHVAVSLLRRSQVVAQHAGLRHPAHHEREVDVAGDAARSRAQEQEGSERLALRQLALPRRHLLAPGRGVEQLGLERRRERLQVGAIFAVVANDLGHVGRVRQPDDQTLGLHQRAT